MADDGLCPAMQNLTATLSNQCSVTMQCNSSVTPLPRNERGLPLVSRCSVPFAPPSSVTPPQGDTLRDLHQLLGLIDDTTQSPQNVSLFWWFYSAVVVQCRAEGGKWYTALKKAQNRDSQDINHIIHNVSVMLWQHILIFLNSDTGSAKISLKI